MVTKLTQASHEKMVRQGQSALRARAEKERCHDSAVRFNGEDDEEYVLIIDQPVNYRWKPDGSDWTQVHSSAWIDPDLNSHAYRIFRKCESMYVVLLCWSDTIRQPILQAVSLFSIVNAAHVI
jgi:hypothetical protein